MADVTAPPSADDVLDALDPEQREVAATPTGPLCVLAGAGTGKTRAITHRIAYGVHSGAYQPMRVLAVTFTARAAGEMRVRLRELGVAGVQARTFHAAALRQLHYFWPHAIGGAAPEILPHKAPVVAEAASRLRLRLDRTELRDVAAEVEWAKVSLLTPESYAAAARREGREPPGMDESGMARLLEVYEEVKGERAVIDFEDVLLLTVGILEERDDIAATVRQQYRHFVVDEYQDVNALQQRLLELWLGGRHEVCVVGDPMQTIYSFTGASPQHLLGFSAAHPGARTVRLVRNYRSTPEVVRLANTLVASMPSGSTARRGAVELVAQRSAGPDPTLTALDDDPAEAAWVAARIRSQLDAGRPASDVAILLRTNGQSEGFESALADAGVPYLVRGGERFFARREVRDAIVLLRGAARTDDESKSLPDTVADVLQGVGYQEEPPAASGAVRARWESLRALVTLAERLAATSPGVRLPELIRELDERAAAQHAPSVEGVTLASLHAAKGLEWPVVHLAGCSDGLMPIVMAEGPDEIEEERRLLYVGMTRARDELHLSWARARTPGARPTRRVSRFLDPLAVVLGEGARSTPKAGGARGGAGGGGARRGPRSARVRHCKGCGTELTTAPQRAAGRCPACPPTYDEKLYERLVTWRRELSAEQSVPAFVVFTDATLEAIADAEPKDVAALRAISGVGARKLELYGEDVLAIVAGDEPAARG
ncbi:ATP-dependent DNA helicase UvrD2 [Marihabitans asiaticum]|uniref:ATP-dependent DNA helicase UvrD2 n=1 Tax=Marihabitans asiaticum TaxID=415218 RepID=UPI001FE4CB7C|nr:ATP-dependent DNA helicase UvrD2 [Marihabitans asiaticum]